MSPADKARLYHDFGTMLRSGFHLDRAVDLMLGQNPSTGRREWLMALKKGLDEKLSVSDALAKHGGERVTELERGLIAAGEKGGRLEESCEHLAGYFDLRQKSISKATGALVYPLILAHLGAMMPDLSSAMEGGGLAGAFGGVPWRILELWIVIGIVVALSLMWLKSARTSVTADRLLTALPMVGGARRHWALARFSQVMQTGLLAALRISESLRLAGEASQSAVLRASTLRAATQVEQGNALALSLRAAGGFPISFVNAVDMAEQSGTLDVEMERWTKSEMELAARAQDRVAEWLPRVVYAFVMIWIAARIIGSFSTYFGKLGAMSNGEL